jgi:hypothetical protein
MADLEWYKTTLERLGKFIAEQLHPEYGPCDSFADGNCSVCLEALGNLKEAYEQKQKYGIPHPVLTESEEYYKGMMVLPQVLCEVVEVDWSGAETRLHLKEHIVGLDIWIEAAQCRHGLPASEIQRVREEHGAVACAPDARA